jgi:CubicO group peptidase (beta-lactamase class C family)
MPRAPTPARRPIPLLPPRLALVAFVAFLALPGLVAPAPVAAQAGALRGLDAWIERALHEWQVPGLAIAVVRNDSVIHARGYGVLELGSVERVDEHTLFAIASTTKGMTAAALGMLVDEGRIGWDDPVSRHLPGLELNDPFITRELTVRDLLTHRAGLARSDNLWIAAPFDRAEVLRRARHLPATGFRAEYGYNNIMYIAAGELVAAVSGISWDDFLEQRLFTPLRMTRSTTRSAIVDTRSNVATAHTQPEGAVVAMARRNYDNIGGAGAAWSSAHDMAQWVRLQLNDGVYGGRPLLRTATLREMHTPQVVMRGDTVAERLFPGTSFRAYGLGWFLHDYHGRKLVHHSGSINWTRTHVGMIPSEGIGVVVIANLSTSNLQQAVMYRVLDALLGQPPRDWSGEYLALARRAREAAARQAAEVEAARRPGTSPSLEAEAYTGRYTHDVYGEVTIEPAAGGLVLRYAPDYTAGLEHWHHDTFRAVWHRTGFGHAFVTFALDSRARVASLQLDGFGTFVRAPAGP